jgi:hypothetical protein
MGAGRDRVTSTTVIADPAIRLTALARAVRARLVGWRSRREIAAFFRLPYEARVEAVKEIYAHRNMLASFERFFAARDRLAVFPQPFYDLIYAYAEALAPAAILQLGCFTATESRWLAMKGCRARLIASDFDADRLAWLEQRFSGTPYAGIAFRTLDLEAVRADELADADLIVCNAVLSNLQPEGLERLMSALAASPVRCLVLSDVYSRETLSPDPKRTRSLPSPVDRNWFHPYLALAAKHGLDAFFLPDFVASSFEAARGIFVIHRHLPQKIHDAAIAAGMRHYLERQTAILTDPGPGA